MDLLYGGIIYRNDGGNTFTQVITGSSAYPSSAFGDYDIDGNLDILSLNLYEQLQVFRNDSGTFNAAWVAPDCCYTYVKDVEWGDYNQDGLPDQLIANDSDVEIFKNEERISFDKAWDTSVTSVALSAKWGDYDGDGDLDFAVGKGGANLIFENLGGDNFWNVYETLESVYTSDVAWGDYDGNGNLDLLAGNGFFSNKYPNSLYRNDGGGNFTLAWTSEESEATNGVAWGDYDGDGNLDQLVCSGYEASGSLRVYRNDLNPLNSTPSIPILIDEPDGTSSKVTLEWNASTDDHTPPALITYQVKLGTCSGCNDVVSGAFAPPYGNAGATTSLSVYPGPDGTYYWSVAAIDNTGFLMSPWSTEDSFTLTISDDENFPAFGGIKTAVGCGSGCVEIAWDAADDPEGSTPITYSIFKSDTADGMNYSSPYVPPRKTLRMKSPG